MRYIGGMTEPWVVRPYDKDIDESGVVYLWLKSFAHSSYGKGRGAQADGSPAEREYWAEHRMTVLSLLQSATTIVLCDPEAPAVIWAFACVSGDDVVHYAVVKRRFKEEGAAMFRALVGDRLDQACSFTHDFMGTGLCVPFTWRWNPYAVLKGTK